MNRDYLVVSQNSSKNPEIYLLIPTFELGAQNSKYFDLEFLVKRLGKVKIISTFPDLSRLIAMDQGALKILILILPGLER